MILTNGCSFTEGYDLPYEQNPWPHHLSNDLNVDFKNIALGGNSNKKIFRSTLEEIVKGCDPSLVIIGWTMHNRTEITHSEGYYCRYTSTDLLPEMSDGFEPDDLDKIHKFWTVHNHNEFLNFREFVYSVLFLQEFFKNKKIKFKFFMALDDNYFFDFLNKTEKARKLCDLGWHWEKIDNQLPSDFENNFYSDLIDAVKKIDISNWILPHTNMNSILCESGFPTDSTQHYYEDGHKYWANMIQNLL